MNNAVEHGNQMKACRNVSVEIAVNENLLEINIGDENESREFSFSPGCCDSVDVLSTRTRGLVALKEMGMEIRCKKGHVKAVMRF